MFFGDNNWRIHPDWVYCNYNFKGEHTKEFGTPEERMRHFISRMQQKGWTWGTAIVRPLPRCHNRENYDPDCDKSEYKGYK